MSKKGNLKLEKAAKEEGRQKYQTSKNQRTWGIVIAVISVLLVLSMVLSSVRF